MERQRSAVDFSAHRPCQFRDFQVFGFAFCDIADTSALQRVKYPISELLIWCEKNKVELRDRWKPNVFCGHFRIYYNGND